METVKRTRPTTPAALHRLAELAHQRGLRVFESPTGHWWCSSHSNAFHLHVVTGFTCDCAGFFHNGRCTHHSLLLEHLGWLPDVEEPAPCRTCHGRGKAWSEHDMELRPCYGCDGTGCGPAHQQVLTPRPVLVESSQIAA
jgi:hypothetical protein